MKCPLALEILILIIHVRVKMDIILTETNKGKRSLVCDSFRYRVDKTLKGEEISWRCTVSTFFYKFNVNVNYLFVCYASTSITSFNFDLYLYHYMSILYLL